IALVRSHLWPQASAAMQQAVESAARLAQAAGAQISAITLPPILEDAYAAQYLIQDYEHLCSLAYEYDHHRDEIDPRLREQLDAATAITAEKYDAARRTASRGRQAFMDVIADCDVILTLSAPGAAPAGFASTGNAMFNRLWTLMGTPCVNVAGLHENGLPLGVQVVGRFGRDRSTLEAALFLEQAIARGMPR
ncbi:MAG TPA: amidase family protein, partial [Stellaceae bacterium]|nr:amidase family protein [Stellaceae bacterium]